jgi:hypothetical protein
MKTSNYTRNLNRLRGFCDGAGARGMAHEFEDSPDYERGYVDGQAAKKEYCKRSAKEFGLELREIIAFRVGGK